MKNLNLYALANELNLGEAKSGTIRVPFGRWDFGAKKLDDGRTVFFVQELTKGGAERMAAKINAGVADGEKGVPVYWGHPDVPEFAHKYPDKRAKGWIKSATVESDALILNVEWLEENATDGFGWFSPYWSGPATDLGGGRYLKHLDSLRSVALINIPNIQEFRLANELQGNVNDNETGANAGEGKKNMDRAKLIQALGLPETATDEDIIAGIENFTDLLEHLDSAFFRGFALAQPIWEADGTVREVVLHNSWEFLVHDGETYHNPECTGWDPRRCVSCADAGLIGIQRRRAIDYPALAVHIRHAVSERDWGRFLERYALPKPAVTMAPNATTENRADYLLAAKAVENGQVSVWPNGTAITDFAGGSRGTDPFNSFIEHQEKLIMLLATGGTLTSLAQADTGSLAGGAQFKVWREIVARDSVVAAQAVMRSLLKPYLQRAFGARPCAISLALEVPAERNAKEAAELAATLRNAGWSVDQGELEKATGFTLEKAPTAPQTPPFAAAKAQTALHFDEKALQNAGKRKDGQSPVQDETALKSQKNGGLRAESGELRVESGELRVPPPNSKLETGNSKLEKAIASIIAETFADELGKAAHPEETLKGSEVEKLKSSESVAAAHASEQPRGKTTPESTPGSFAPADGGKTIILNNRPADKAGSHGDSGSSGEPAEAAHYTAEHRSKVGQSGDWKSLDLPSLRDITPDEPRGEGKTKLADARKRIAKGETIKDPLGASHEINAKTTSHWTKKGKNIADVNERLALLDEAEDTISKPHEIWKGVKRKGTAFIRMVKTPDGKSVINVAEMKDGTVSWHGNEVSFDYWREGKLLYVR